MSENTIKPSSLRLSHFSKTPLKLENLTYPSNKIYDLRGTYFDKPQGLWLSDESDYGWKSWCKENQFNLKNLKYQIEFDVSLEGILLLKTEKDMLSFTKEFSEGNPTLFALPNFKMQGIDWDKVKQKYHGIIITPYQGNVHFTLSWYYGWDCASGCIWNLSNLTEVVSPKTNVIPIRGVKNASFKGI